MTSGSHTPRNKNPGCGETPAPIGKPEINAGVCVGTDKPGPPPIS